MGNTRQFTSAYIKTCQSLGMELGKNGIFMKPKIVKRKKTSETVKKEQIFLYVKDIFPDVVAEYKFLEDRKFQFDWFIPSKNCGIEYEGLFCGKSRHTEIVGYNNDCEKYTLASLNGYKLIRITAMTTWVEFKNYLDKLNNKENFNSLELQEIKKEVPKTWLDVLKDIHRTEVLQEIANRCNLPIEIIKSLRLDVYKANDTIEKNIKYVLKEMGLTK